MTTDKKSFSLKAAKQTILKLLTVLFAILIFMSIVLICSESTKNVERAAALSATRTPADIISSFRPSPIEYSYSNIVYEQNTEDRVLSFISVDETIEAYGVQYSGSVQIGVRVSDIEFEVLQDGDVKILKIYVPDAYILSHEVPVGNTCKVMFDLNGYDDKYDVTRYADAFESFKAASETQIIRDEEMFQAAREYIILQLELLLAANSDVTSGYVIDFVNW